MHFIIRRRNIKIVGVKIFQHYSFNRAMAPPIKSVSSPCCFDADNILNNSQGLPSHSQNLRGNAVGHPRYHVLCKRHDNTVEILENLPSLGCTEVVTGHQGNWKTAFLTKEDQNEALHKILKTDDGRNAIKQLEQGRDEVVLRAPMRSLMPNLMMTKVSNGERQETVPAQTCLLILGHHVGKPEGVYVHVKTFYPMEG